MSCYVFIADYGLNFTYIILTYFLLTYLVVYGNFLINEYDDHDD